MTPRLVLVALTAVAVVVLASAGAAAVQLMLVSDLHLDPFYGKPNATDAKCAVAPRAANVLGAYRCDAPLELVASAIRRAGAEDPDLVLVAGDWLRHKAHTLSPATVRESVSNITALLNDAFVRGRTVAAARPQVLDALGNNDMVPDFAFNVSATHRLALSEIAASLRENEMLSAEEAANFSQCGSYRREVTGLGPLKRSLDVIVVNTLVWATHLKPPLSPQERERGDPCGALAFLESSLAATTNPVIIVGHVPPGVNTFYATVALDGGTPVDDVPLFCFHSFEARFRAIVGPHRERIRALIFGHSHHVQMVTDASLAVPILFLGSVSPVYNNLPSLQELTLDDDTLRPQWSTLRQIGLANFSAGAAWRDTSPSFQQMMGLPPASAAFNATAAGAAAIFALMLRANARVLDNASALAAFRGYSSSYATEDPPCSDKCQAMTGCSLLHMDAASTIACYKRRIAPSSYANGGTAQRVASVAIAALYCVAIVAAVVILRARASQARAPDASSDHGTSVEDVA